MATITVPKELGKNKDLVAVPRKSYEAFLAWQKKVKSKKTFAPTADEKKAAGRAKENFARGNYTTPEKLRHELADTR